MYGDVYEMQAYSFGSTDVYDMSGIRMASLTYPLAQILPVIKVMPVSCI